MPAELSLAASLPSISGAGVKPSDFKNPEEAAKQFEALLIEEMLKSARAGGSGDWMGESGDQSGSALSEMAEQQFAQLLAANGGVGLAKLVADGLSRASAEQAAKVDAN
jgi:Rod binding domain-containing protein